MGLYGHCFGDGFGDCAVLFDEVGETPSWDLAIVVIVTQPNSS